MFIARGIYGLLNMAHKLSHAPQITLRHWPKANHLQWDNSPERLAPKVLQIFFGRECFNGFKSQYSRWTW